MTNRCQHILPSGEQCQTKRNISSAGYCYHHCPDRAAERIANATVGRRSQIRAREAGIIRATNRIDWPKDPPKTAEDAVKWASIALHATARGHIDAKIAATISTLARTVVAGLEKSKMEAELREARATLEKLKDRLGDTA